MDEASEHPPKGPLLQRALSHPRRTAMLGYLMRKRDGGTDEVELAGALGLSVPGARYHLRVLHDADLIADVGDRRPGTTGRYIVAASTGA